MREPVEVLNSSPCFYRMKKGKDSPNFVEALESGPIDLAQLEAEVDFESCRDLPGFVSMLTEAKEEKSRPR